MSIPRVARRAVRLPRAGRSKYGAVRETVDGITFHSRAEARRYRELKALERAGQISGLLCQPTFDLYVEEMSVGAHVSRVAARLAGKGYPGTPVKLGRYVADFSYWQPPMSDPSPSVRVVEDVKGFQTPLFRWKRKHVEAQYGIQIRLIK